MSCEKITYPTHGAAAGACQGMGKRGNSMYSYKCTHCGMWHLATRKKKKTLTKTKRTKWKQH